MSTSMGAVPKPRLPFRPQLDGADPLLKAVVREVSVDVHANILCQGDVPHTAHLLLKGFACRYRLLQDGRRQVTAILVPGDICDLEAVLRGHADHAVATLSPCTLGAIPADQIVDRDRVDPELHRVALRQLLRDEAIAREWMVGLGQRTAKERLAHLFCELWERLRSVGLCDADGYELGIRQVDLADASGLSTVHVNRVLKELREGGLIVLRKGAVHIFDYVALVQVAGFDPGYLEFR